MKRILPICLALSGGLFFLPILIGILGVIVPAIGYFPPLGKTALSGEAFAHFFAIPSALHAIWLSLFIGLASSFLSLLACFALLSCGAQAGWGRRLLRLHRRLMGPLIALPHSTIAIALLFLLAPSGWLVRLISPELTGWVRPPAFGFVPDQTGWLLIVGLMLKEIPFLLFIALAISQILPINRLQAMGQSLGYRPVVSWAFIIWPQIYQQMRLPILAVLAYSLTVVDMTLILGPGLPPPLAVLVLQGFQDAHLEARLPASAGAVVQIFVVIAGILIWLAGERLVGLMMRLALLFGARLSLLPAMMSAVFLTLTAAFALLSLGLLAIALWAFANRWHFADKWPSDFGFRYWQTEAAFGAVMWHSVIIAFGASLICVMLCAFWLELIERLTKQRDRVIGVISFILFIPLFVPQISLLFGLQVALSWSYLDGYLVTVMLSHCLYILPYVWLILAPSYQGYEPRYWQIARTMGLGAMGHFWRLRLPVLGHSFGSALILGVAVSIALYLPSVFAGAGRVSTITTEAVTLAASGARGPSAQAALMQMCIPLAVFLAIRFVLFWRFGRFSAMQGHSHH